VEGSDCGLLLLPAEYGAQELTVDERPVVTFITYDKELVIYQ